ncbi:MAG: hypothetical protein Q8Q59_06815 [Luteolibacter sp.]|jgi:hypothetical protein|nr:hypothetical protein [Luteolibacter sp.]
MHLPTPQFSRLVTVLAFDLTNPALDSMIRAWDHISARFLRQISPNPEIAGNVESIRLLAIHDAVHSIFGSAGGYIFTDPSPTTSLDAALAATAQASHDVLAGVFESPEDRSKLKDTLEESLSLISDEREIAAGIATGAKSAATYARTFAPLSLSLQLANAGEKQGSQTRHERIPEPSRPSLQLAKNPNWRFDWRKSA